MATCALIASCYRDDLTYPTPWVGLTPVRATIAVGDSTRFFATPEAVKDKRVTWSTSDASVVTIRYDGWARAIRAGSVAITATSVQMSSLNSSASVTVTTAP